MSRGSRSFCILDGDRVAIPCIWDIWCRFCLQSRSISDRSLFQDRGKQEGDNDADDGVSADGYKTSSTSL